MLGALQHAAAADQENPIGGRVVQLKGPSGKVWKYHLRENREPTQEELSSMSWDVLEREKEAGGRPAPAPPAWPQTESKSPIPNSLAETVGAMIAPKAPAKSTAAPRSPEWVAEQAVRKYPKVDASHKALATEYAKSSGATVAQLTKMVGSQQWEAMRSHLAMRPLDPGDPNFVARLLEQQRVIDAAKARQKEARKVTIGPNRYPGKEQFTDTQIDEQMLQSLSPAALEAEVARRKAAHLANPRNTLEREEYTRAFEAAQGRSGLLGMLNIGQVLEDVRITAQSALTREEGSQLEKAAALGQTAFNVGALDAAIGGLVGKVAKAAIARFRRFAKTGDIAAIAREISTLAPAERAAATSAFKDVLPPVGQKARFERGVHEISNSLDIPRGEARQVAKAFRTVAGDYPHNMNGEVQDVMGLMDAAAATWTKNTGRTLEEWNQMFGIDKPARKPIESTSATRGIAQTPEEFIAERWRTRTEAEIAEIDSILSGEKPADLGKKAWRQQQAQARETLRPIRAELQASLESGVPHPTIEKELRAAHELFTPPPKAPVEPPKIEEPAAAVEPPPEPVAAERPGGNGTPPPKVAAEPPPVEEVPPPRAQETPNTAPVRDVTGLANQEQARQAAAGIVDAIEPSKGQGAEHWQALGKRRVAEGVDPDALAVEVGAGKVALTGERTGILLEGDRLHANRVNAAAEALDEAIKQGDPLLVAERRKAFEAAKEARHEYLANVQAGKGAWSDVGRALQAGAELDTGNYADVLQAAEREAGRPLTSSEQKTLQRLVEQLGTKSPRSLPTKVAALQEELAKLRAKSAAGKTSTRKPRFDKQALDDELQDLTAQLRETMAKASAGLDPELIPIVGRIAINYAKRGVNTLDDVVARTIEFMKREGIEVSRQDVIDAMAGPQERRTLSEIKKELARLKREARSKSTIGSARKVEGYRTRIADLETQIRTKRYRVATRREQALTREIEALKGRADILARQVRAEIKALGRSPMEKAIDTVLDAVAVPKTLLASADVSFPFIQGGAALLTDPKAWLQAWTPTFEVMRQEGFERFVHRMGQDEMAQRGLGAGLDLGVLKGDYGEEFFISKFAEKWAPGVAVSNREFGAMGAKMRLEMFRSMVEALEDGGEKLTRSQLRVVADHVNTITGRGVLLRGHGSHSAKIAAAALFSPRYWSSLFETALARPAWNAALEASKTGDWRVFKAVAKKYAKLYAVAGSMMVAGKYAFESAGWEVIDDPHSTDFGRARRKLAGGDTVTIDLIPGQLQQPVRFLTQMITGRRVGVTGKEETGFRARGSTLIGTIQGKVAPLLSVGLAVQEGERFGESFDLKTPEGIANTAKGLLVPISAQNALDLAQAPLTPWEKAVYLAVMPTGKSPNVRRETQYDSLTPKEDAVTGNLFGLWSDRSQPDPVVRELAKYGVNITRATRETDENAEDYDATDAEWMDRVQFVGQQIHEELQRELAREGYRSASPEKKKERLKQAYSDARSDANEEYKSIVRRGERFKWR